MIRFSNGDMFESGADALVNTVNLVGVMGKGVALQFKERFKYNFQQYKHACENCKIGIGNSLVVKEKWKDKDVLIVNLPTKKHWRNKSEYSYIDMGLTNLVDIIEKYKISSIAIPPLGAGNGGLDWTVVKSMIIEKLKNVDSEIIVYEPGHKAVSVPRDAKLTKARALLLYMLEKQKEEGLDLTEFSSVKLAYFLQFFGAKNYMKLDFEKCFYGPYCYGVKMMLHNIDGAYIRGFADNDKRAFEPFDVIDERMSEVNLAVEKDISLATIVNETLGFLKGYWDDFSLELLSSIAFILSQNNKATKDDVYLGLHNWDNTGRKAKLFSDKEVVSEAYSKVLPLFRMGQRVRKGQGTGT